MKEIGNLLQETRENKGLSMSDAAKELKVRENYIQMLESGDVSTISKEIYIIGCLKSYADWLGMDGSDLVSKIRSSNNLDLSKALALDSQALFYTVEDLVRPSPKILLLSVLLTIVIYMFLYQEEDKSFDGESANIITSVDVLDTKSKDFILLAREEVSLKIFDHNGNIVSRQVMQAGEAYFLSSDEYVVEADNPDYVEIFNDGENSSFLGTLSDNSILQPS